MLINNKINKVPHIYYLIWGILLFPKFCLGQLLLDTIYVNEEKTSTRGLFQVNDKVVWVSGTGGVILKTNNGKKWELNEIPKLKALDFRDIHAFNKKEAIIMSSGDGCEFYKTYDGGKKWEKVYENKTEGIFFDGMDFWNEQDGIAFSDPIEGKIYLIETIDSGNSWHKVSSNYLPSTLQGEAGFAASGTGIVCVGDSVVFIGTGGGEKIRVFRSKNRGKTWQVFNTPLRGGEGNGIYSMAFKDEKNGVIIGGNYLDSTYSEAICATTKDGGITWQLASKPPDGYRSCITYSREGVYISCGRTGIDISKDGDSWHSISNDGYYSCVATKKKVWFVGRQGKMAEIDFRKIKKKLHQFYN